MRWSKANLCIEAISPAYYIPDPSSQRTLRPADIWHNGSHFLDPAAHSAVSMYGVWQSGLIYTELTHILPAQLWSICDNRTTICSFFYSARARQTFLSQIKIKDHRTDRFISRQEAIWKSPAHSWIMSTSKAPALPLILLSTSFRRITDSTQVLWWQAFKKKKKKV